MGSLRMRTVGGTIVLAVILVLAGCSGGGGAGTPTATGTATETPATTAADTATPDGDVNETGGGSDDGGTDWNRYYVFNDSEAYGYEVRLPNETTQMSWVVTGTADASPELYDEVSVRVDFGQYSTNATASHADIFGSVISEGSVGGPFLYVRTPVVLARGHDLRVGNSWTIQGEDVTVGDGFEVNWDEATAEITGTASVAGETCYTMKLRVPGNETGPTSCVKADWPFALAVDTGTQDYRLAEFDRP